MMAHAAWVIPCGWMVMALLMAALFLWCRRGTHVGVVDAFRAPGVGGPALYALMAGDGLLRGKRLLSLASAASDAWRTMTGMAFFQDLQVDSSAQGINGSASLP